MVGKERVAAQPPTRGGVAGHPYRGSRPDVVQRLAARLPEGDTDAETSYVRRLGLVARDTLLGAVSMAKELLVAPPLQAPEGPPQRAVGGASPLVRPASCLATLPSAPRVRAGAAGQRPRPNRVLFEQHDASEAFVTGGGAPASRPAAATATEWDEGESNGASTESAPPVSLPAEVIYNFFIMAPQELAAGEGQAHWNSQLGATHLVDWRGPPVPQTPHFGRRESPGWQPSF